MTFRPPAPAPDAELEAWPIEPGDSLQWDADTINPR
jgi:hypothetical protein